jgi:hypothetical protein
MQLKAKKRILVCKKTQKAESDILELKRDLSTYESNFVNKSYEMVGSLSSVEIENTALSTFKTKNSSQT